MAETRITNNSTGLHDLLTYSPCLNNRFTDSPCVHALLTDSPGLHEFFTDSPVLQNLITDSAALNNLLTDSPSRGDLVEQIIGDEQTLFIMRVLMFGVTPAISLFGVIGNILSVIILTKHGLHKCSNITLVVLAINDMAFLIGFNSVPKLLYEVIGDSHHFSFSFRDSYVLYIFYQIFHIMDYASGEVSLSLPVVITIERLVAVFLPLKFHQIVTPARTWFAVVFISFLWYSLITYMSFYTAFSYEFDARLNISVGLIQRSAYLHANLRDASLLEEAMSLLVTKIPPALTFAGCTVIGIKIKLASSRRRKMTSNGRADGLSHRTTKMLLAVCLLYTLTCATVSLPTYIPQFVYYTLTRDAPNNVGTILYQVSNIVLCINGSSNFIIYVVMNRNFRETYKSLLIRKAQNKLK